MEEKSSTAPSTKTKKNEIKMDERGGVLRVTAQQRSRLSIIVAAYYVQEVNCEVDVCALHKAQPYHRVECHTHVYMSLLQCNVCKNKTKNCHLFPVHEPEKRKIMCESRERGKNARIEIGESD